VHTHSVPWHVYVLSVARRKIYQSMDNPPAAHVWSSNTLEDTLICLYYYPGYPDVNTLPRVDLLAAQTNLLTLVTVTGWAGAGLSWKQL